MDTPPLPLHEKIRSHLHLTIHSWCLCLATLTPDLILAGKSRLQNGVPYSSVSSRENHSVILRMIMACRMSQSGVCCGRHCAAKRDVSAQISRNRQESMQRLHKQSMDEASPTLFPGASGTRAVYHSRVQHTWEAPGQKADGTWGVDGKGVVIWATRLSLQAARPWEAGGKRRIARRS